MAVFTFLLHFSCFVLLFISWAHILKKAICWDVTSLKIRLSPAFHTSISPWEDHVGWQQIGWSINGDHEAFELFQQQQRRRWRQCESRCTETVHRVKCDSIRYVMLTKGPRLSVGSLPFSSVTEKAPYFASGTNFAKRSRWTGIQFKTWWTGATSNFFNFSLMATARLYLTVCASPPSSPYVRHSKGSAVRRVFHTPPRVGDAISLSGV